MTDDQLTALLILICGVLFVMFYLSLPPRDDQ